MRSEKIAKHFCGEETTPLALNVKNGSEKFKIVVDFGRLVLPKIEGLESFGKVKPLPLGRAELTPHVVTEILSSHGALCSADDEQREKLREWFKENFPAILKLYVRKHTQPPTTPPPAEVIA